MSLSRCQKLSISVIALMNATSAFAELDAQNPGTMNLHQGAYIQGTLGSGLGGAKDQDGEVDGGFWGVGGTAAVGYQINPYLGIEADFTGIDTPFNSSMYNYGIVLKGTLPIGDRFSLYGKAGGGASTTHLCDFLFNSGYCTSVTEGVGLVGAGFAVALTPQVDLGVDYTGAINDNEGADGLLGVLGASMTYHF